MLEDVIKKKIKKKWAWLNLKESINIIFSFRFFYRKELNAGKEQLVKQNVMAID
jgi:hypothetical protein